MTNFSNLKFPVELDLLISFIDLTNFAKTSMKRTDLETFNYISQIDEIIGDEIENAGGKVLKFIGDSALIVFPQEYVNEGILALYNLKKKIDKFNKEKGLDSQLIVKCHFGKAIIGLLGTKSDKRLDIMGSEVNTAAMLKSNGFAMTAETFRKLNAETRKLFKKHTPPITYIPVEEHHKD